MYTCAYCCSSIVIVLGLAEHSQHMTETPKQRLRVRQSEAKWTQVWESGVRPQSMSSSTKGAKARGQAEWSEKTEIVKLLHYAILVLDESCSTSLMSEQTFQEHTFAHFVHASACLKICPLQSLTVPTLWAWGLLCACMEMWRSLFTHYYWSGKASNCCGASWAGFR